MNPGLTPSLVLHRRAFRLHPLNDAVLRDRLRMAGHSEVEIPSQIKSACSGLAANSWVWAARWVFAVGSLCSAVRQLTTLPPLSGRFQLSVAPCVDLLPPTCSHNFPRDVAGVVS